MKTRSNIQASIGIFDSGVGGLTVFRRIEQALPRESLVYLGDTARVPYGSKSGATVVRYAKTCAKLLLQRDIKMLVVACNTASAYALDALRDNLDIPVIGVIEPGAKAACRHTQTGRVGVIGTRGTISTGSYEKIIRQLRPDCLVYSKACPLFVPFAEEGWTSGPAIHEIAETYLGDLLKNEIDTLVLGCTHYPLLSDVIAEVAGEAVTLVDSAGETARAVAATLEASGLVNTAVARGTLSFLVTDGHTHFREMGEQFLGHPLDTVEWVDVQEI
ncbi:MAG: Glutamate racemase 1 [Candidatus Hydrogenedentes bacterium ADurb.Bin179]|nr:MAG: Glutamate racemase 1 [Candidatus Hydrogenedentes bacterium ADurb.Bin179]